MIMKHKPKYRKKHVKRRKLIEVDYDATLFTDKDLFSKQDMIYNNIEKLNGLRNKGIFKKSKLYDALDMQYQFLCIINKELVARTKRGLTMNRLSIVHKRARKESK